MAKTRKRYNKGKRVDMRTGGRVRLAHGGEPLREDYGPGQLGQQKYNEAWSAWNAEHAGGANTSNPTNPFPDTSNVPYGNVTEDQAEKARTQIEDAATGKLPDDTKIPTPQTLDSGVYTAEQMKSWQEGGQGGTIAKNEQGYTSKDIMEMLTEKQPMPAGQNYTMLDAIKLLQE